MEGNTHKVGGLLFASTSLAIANISIATKGIVLAPLLVGAMSGSLLPDIDKKNTKASNNIPILGSIIPKITKHRGFTHTPLANCLFGAIAWFSNQYLLNVLSNMSETPKVILTSVFMFLCVKSALKVLKVDDILVDLALVFAKRLKSFKKVSKEKIKTYNTFLQMILCVILSYTFSDSTSYLFTAYTVGLIIGYFSHIVLDMLNGKGVPLLAPFTNKKINVANFTTGKIDKTLKPLLSITTIFVIIFTFV